MALLLYVTKAVTLEGMLRHIGRRLGIKLAPLVTPDGRLAIDVDNERTHRVAEELLARDPGTADPTAYGSTSSLSAASA